MATRVGGEICNFDPGFGDDLVVRVLDPLMFARWHLGLVDWRYALRAGAIDLDGPRELRRALPTWNAGPVAHARKRAEHQQAPGSPPAFPPEAVPAPVRLPAGRAGVRTSPSRIAGFEGQLITADDPDYDTARAVWNGAVDRKPRYIARCQSPPTWPPRWRTGATTTCRWPYAAAGTASPARRCATTAW